MSLRPSAAATVALALGVLAVLGCDDKPGATPTTDSASTTAGAPTASTSASSAPRETMPNLEVDEKGPSVGIDRVDLAKPNGPKLLHDLVKDLPAGKLPSVVLVARNAKTPDVAALVRELGLAGAATVTIKTDGRDDLPKELVVVPEQRIDKPDKCSIVATVIEDGATAVWAFEGGTAKRHRKGLAGPDLSHTHETLVKAIPQCSSKTAFFSANAKYAWEFAFNIGGSILKADEKKQIERLVLVGEEPVAGRPVKLRSD
ncbi:MAG: biopolymer transporter ExbD [Polyangiaceae bacterium]|nr:biopolymer transporter ExbD [Polyangiaceae bacterium]